MIGIDIVEISRIENAIKNESFYNKLLLKSEKEYVDQKSYKQTKVGHSPRACSIAGFFSAKEAVLKAFGVGLTFGFGLLDVEILHDEKGAPIVSLSPALKELLKQKNKKNAKISISHDGNYAIAICMLE